MSFQPMRWDCALKGCFNRTQRLNFGVFYDALPGKISFTDTDGCTEICGNELRLEWKSVPAPLPTGQKIQLERITRGTMISAIIVAGEAGDKMEATHMAKYWNGRWYSWAEATTRDVFNSIKHWADWAQTHPRFGGANPKTIYYHYVKHAERAAFERCGWVFSADLGPTHGQYSVLMQWAGAGEPKRPQ